MSEINGERAVHPEVWSTKRPNALNVQILVAGQSCGHGQNVTNPRANGGRPFCYTHLSSRGHLCRSHCLFWSAVCSNGLLYSMNMVCTVEEGCMVCIFCPPPPLPPSLKKVTFLFSSPQQWTAQLSFCTGHADFSARTDQHQGLVGTSTIATVAAFQSRLPRKCYLDWLCWVSRLSRLPGGLSSL